MKVYLDDERAAPQGWHQVRWPDEAIQLLESGDVTRQRLRIYLDGTQIEQFSFPLR